MTYFNTEFLAFFKDLAENNNSEWFNENRKRYEKEVKKPFTMFVDDIILAIQEYEPEVDIKPSDAIMRINKDIRFSKVKIPYNTHVAANISKYGKKDKTYPGFYIQLSNNGVAIYGGAYIVESTNLKRIRSYIANHTDEFSAAYNDQAFKNKFGQIRGDKNKRIPQEFQVLVDKEPLIANKQFYYTADLEPDIITSDQLKDKLMEYYLAGHGVNQFLKKAFK